MLIMVKMVKEPDEEFMHDAPITSSRFLEEPKDEIKWEEFKPYKRLRKAKT